METRVDHRALQFNQASIIALLVLAILSGWTWLVAFVTVVMLVGTLRPQAGLFKWIYAALLKPVGLLKPMLRADNPQSHLFAQGLGGLFLAAAVVAFFLGASLAGWFLTALVIVLAAVNLFFGFCLGCFVYYQLARRGIHVALPQWQPARPTGAKSK